MARHELSDEAWEHIVELLPTAGDSGGRPWNDHRRTINGIFWILRTGAPWRDLPAEFRAWKSVYGRFNRWSKAGTFDGIIEALRGCAPEYGWSGKRIACSVQDHA